MKNAGKGYFGVFQFKRLCMTIMNYLKSTTPCIQRSYFYFRNELYELNHTMYSKAIFVFSYYLDDHV